MAWVTPSSLKKGTPRIRTGRVSTIPTPAIATRCTAGRFESLIDFMLAGSNSFSNPKVGARCAPGAIKNESCAIGASISVVSEPRAVATGSYAQPSINTYFGSYCLIRSLPLAVLTRFVATLTFNYTLSDTGGRDFLAYGV